MNHLAPAVVGGGWWLGWWTLSSCWTCGVVLCDVKCGFVVLVEGLCGQALGLLVPVGWALLLYTSGLSTQCSVGGLTRLRGWETSS